MSIHVWCNPTDHTYTISSGTGTISGLTYEEYRRFLGDVKVGTYNAGALYREALARHRHLLAEYTA